MTNLLRITAAAAALALSATPALAQTQPDKQATATARIVKPLTLTWVQDLDLGSITLVNSGSTTVGISRAGVFSCPSGNVTCSGTPQVAKYKITGVNNTNVTVNTGNVTLTNSADPSKTLTMTVDSPGTVNLGNSGTAGTDFSLGGNITVSGATVEGTYSGTFAVTVNY
ncbi:MAG TPA: DUF4402 domain-containing protein [Sphingomicrobium sp.]|nr:DUF4402 domain-containing protein [Sphingomicrobium sp.]